MMEEEEEEEEEIEEGPMLSLFFIALLYTSIYQSS